MRRLAHALIRLYPAYWRKRYGEEFEALLEDSSPDLRALFDLMKGAIKMRLTLPSFPKLALILSVAGVLTGLGVSFLVTPRYVSIATLQFIAAPGSPESDVRRVAIELEQNILSRTSLANIISDLRMNLYPGERAKIPLIDVIEHMRDKDLRIAIAAPGSAAMSISFAYRDRVKARDTVQTLVNRFIEMNLVRKRARANLTQARTGNQIDRLESRIAIIEKRLGITTAPVEQLDRLTGPLEGINVDVLDPPSLPVNPVAPDRSVFMLCGFGTGFSLAIVIAIFRRRVPPVVPFPATTA